MSEATETSATGPPTGRWPRLTDPLLAWVRLDLLMALSGGQEAVAVAVLDGPVDALQPDLVGSTIRGVGDASSSGCTDSGGVACRHGTFVAGVLSARRTATPPGICPDCTLLVRPVFSDAGDLGDGRLGAPPSALAGAILDSMRAGARVVNISGAIARARIAEERELHDALDEASRRGVLVVAAAGNENRVGGSPITNHPWVVAVVAYGRDGRPMTPANFGRSIGRGGIGAPGENVTGIAPGGTATSMSGSSVAAPFVAGTAALLWSLFPSATAQEIRTALVHPLGGLRRTIVPPVLDAWASYHALAGLHYERRS